MKKLIREVCVKNALGLHTRPATMIVKLLQNCKSSVSLTHKHETADAKSILSILMLAVQRDSSLTITVDGEDAEEIMERLVDIFEKKFGE